MKLYIASTINALLLIGIGLWAYFASSTPSLTALIPVIIGVVLLAIQSGIKQNAKPIVYIGLALTAIVLIGLLKPLVGAFDRGSVLGITRVLVMMGSSAIALFYFIQHIRRK